MNGSNSNRVSGLFVLAAALTVFSGLGNSAARSAEHGMFVSIQLNDGRHANGIIDERTDDDRLWLRSTATRTVLHQSFAWTNLTTAIVDGQWVAIDDLKKLAQQAQTAMAPGFFEAFSPSTAPSAWDTAITTPSQRLPYRLEPPHETWRVSDLILEVEFDNWDRDVDVDGYHVRVIPINDYHRPVPFSGQLTVSLIGDDYFRHRYWDIDRRHELERWSFEVHVTDFVDGVVELRLPFRYLHPEGDLGVDPWAMLHARLAIPGQDPLGRSQPVRIRPFDYVRNRWQKTNWGDRYYYTGDWWWADYRDHYYFTHYTRNRWYLDSRERFDRPFDYVRDRWQLDWADRFYRPVEYTTTRGR